MHVLCEAQNYVKLTFRLLRIPPPFRIILQLPTFFLHIILCYDKS